LDLFDAHRKGLPLVIDTGMGGERLMAEVFALSEFGQGAGIVFADTGWPDPGSHPFHIIPGEITEDDDDWRVGDRPVRIAFEGEQLYESWQLWKQLASDSDRAQCLGAIKHSGIMATAEAA
jgi:hypothetical protein